MAEAAAEAEAEAADEVEADRGARRRGRRCRAEVSRWPRPAAEEAEDERCRRREAEAEEACRGARRPSRAPRQRQLPRPRRRRRHRPRQAARLPAKQKKKRLPRALRPQRTKPKREKPAERKPITRLPKPEHARGRRQERQGKVVSAAMDKTIVVRVDTVKMHPRYKKVIRRSSKLHAHDEQNEAKVGDIVLIVETRPLSRMKRWRLTRVVEAAK